MNANNQGAIEYHMKKLDQGASGLIGVTMVMEAMLVAEGDADSRFPHKINDFVGGCLVSALLTLAWAVSDEQAIISELLAVEN